MQVKFLQSVCQHPLHYWCTRISWQIGLSVCMKINRSWSVFKLLSISFPVNHNQTNPTSRRRPSFHNGHLYSSHWHGNPFNRFHPFELSSMIREDTRNLHCLISPEERCVGGVCARRLREEVRVEMELDMYCHRKETFFM